MKRRQAIIALALAIGFGCAGFLGTAASAQAEGTVTERVAHYTVTGKTGAALYAAIGQHGPKLGSTRVIAHTGFKLTWRRDYQERDGGCVLASAIPKLVITYTLPKVSGRLDPSVAESWQRFSDGVAAHERVHGESIRQMVSEIEAFSVGLSAPGDPGCKKVRAELVKRLKAASDAQQARSAEFDRVEMGQGGAVEKLVLDLVNGP